MKKYVLDSYSLLTYAENTTGADEIGSYFKKALEEKVELFVSVINWGEIYYLTLRDGGKDNAELLKKTFERYPLTIVDVDSEQSILAAKIKAAHNIPFTEAFAVALAKDKKTELITSNKNYKKSLDDFKIKFVGDNNEY